MKTPKPLKSMIDKTLARRSGATGIYGIDTLIPEFRSGELIVIGGRGSAGKTSLALQFAGHASICGHRPAAFCSLESTVDEILPRILGSDAGIPKALIRSQRMTEKQWHKLAVSASRIRKAPLYIADGELDIDDFTTSMKEIKKRLRIEMLVLDSLRQITDSTMDDSNISEEASIIIKLKKAAKEMSLVVIVTAQVDSVAGETIHVGQLEGAESFEDVADIVFHIEQVTDLDTIDIPDSESSREMRILILKNRNGPIGSADVLFRPDLSYFFETEVSETSGPPF